MATNLFPKLFVLALAAILMVAAQATDPNDDVTRLSLYLHDYSSGPKATDVTVTGIPGKLWGFNQFGTLNVFDDPITLTPYPNSGTVGRMQGISMTSELNGHSAHETFSFVFTTNDEYDGSTLSFQGINKGQYAKVREFAVVGGTGQFRLARGYALFQTVRTDDTKGYMLLFCDVTLQQSPYLTMKTPISASDRVILG